MHQFHRQVHGSKNAKDQQLLESRLKESLLERFKCSDGNRLNFINDDGVDIPPYVCQYSLESNSIGTCLIADEEGFVSLVRANSNSHANDSVKVAKKWRCHRNAIFDVAWAERNTFATASGDTTAVVWDANGSEKPLNILRGHSCSLKSVCVSKHFPNLIATGARDGNALIWDSRCNHSVLPPALRIQDAHAVHDALTPQKRRRRKIAVDLHNQLLHDSRQTVTSVIFQDGNTLVTSGAMDGTLKLWDLRKIQPPPAGKFGRSSSGAKPKESIRYPGASSRRRGYTCLTMDSKQSRLFASCTDDTIYEYDLSNHCPNESRTPTSRYYGHLSSSFYVKISMSPDDMFLLSGSDEDKAYIWNTTLKGNAISPCAYLYSDDLDQVTSVDWCPSDWMQIVTCSDDCAARFWALSEQWPTNEHFEGVCRKLPPKVLSKRPDDIEKLDAFLENRDGSTTNSPTSRVFSSLSISSLNCSPGSQPTPKHKQPSLRRWLQASSPTTQQSGSPSPKRSRNKENVPSSSSVASKTISRRLLATPLGVSPEKVLFRSQKPQKKKNSADEKRLETLEDFFLHT